MTCRPEKLTCRWLFEISEAIENCCPAQKRIIECVKNNEEKVWSDYNKNFLNQCLKQKNVQDILSFKVDYNEFRQNRENSKNEN